MSAFHNKITKFRKILYDLNIDSLIINDQINFSYITGGRGYINVNGGGVVAPLVITKDKVYLIANNIEAGRLKKEEIHEDVNLMIYPWYDLNQKDELIKKISGKFVFDTQIPEKTANIRYTIDDNDMDFYKEMAKDTAYAVENACKTIQPGMSEWEIASIMCENCLEKGIEPSVHLVGTDERAILYRHPLPTGRKLEKLAILSVNGMKQGMWVSVTRMVYFGRPSDELIRRHRAVINVDACFILNTKIGSKVGDIFEKAVIEYERQGYKGEWKNHHQGGMTGYNSREFRAYKGMDIIVSKNQAYAWNPTIKGTKSEDTILVTNTNAEILTYTGDYEYTEVSFDGQKILRPDILIR